MQVKDLNENSKKVNIVVKLIARSEPRYAKGYKIVTFTAADATGQVAIPFWNNDAEAVKVGDYIEIENGYISTFRDKLQLNIGKFGSFQVVDPPEGFEISDTSPAEAAPSETGTTIPIEFLEQRTRDLTVHVLLKEKIEERTVRTRQDGKEHRVATYLVGDESGCILLNLWDERIDIIPVGATVLIQGAYVRAFRGQRFLNISRNGKIDPTAASIRFNGSNNLSEKATGDFSAGSGATS